MLSASKAIPDRQFIKLTTWSENIEEHAAPPTMHGVHPSITSIPVESIPEMTASFLRKHKWAQRIANGNVEGQFPRVIIEIVDPDLKEVAKEKNPAWYNDKENEKYGDNINNIKVADVKCNCNPHLPKRGFERILGLSDVNVDAMVYGNCRHTLFAAAKRQIKSAPTPDPQIAKEFVQFAKQVIDKELGPYLDDFGYSFNQWYSHLPYKKQRRMDMVKHFYNKEYDMIPPVELNKLIENCYEAIPKAELQPLDGKPRMVCSIPDRIKYIMGPITWALEDIAAHHLNGYCGGKNLTEMAQVINAYLDQGFTKVIQGDGSAFDNTQDYTLKEVERYIYRKIADKVHHVPKEEFLKTATMAYKVMKVKYSDDKNPKKLRNMMIYHILGTVFSGDCDTTLGNTIRMCLYNRFIMEKAGYRIGHDYQLFSKGDDFSVLVKPEIPNQDLEKAYYKYFLPASKDKKIVDDRTYGIGQVCKFLEFGGPESFKFCSLRSWYIDHTHITLTRDPSKLFTLSKYSRKTKSMNSPQMIQYLIDQATALKVNYPGIKLFETMALLYLARAHSIKAESTTIKKKMINSVQKIQDKRVTLLVTDETQYGMTPEKYQLFYNVKEREDVILIQDSYWETMKYIENQRNDKLTPDQIHYVNQQIEAEFSSEELTALLAQ